MCCSILCFVVKYLKVIKLENTSNTFNIEFKRLFNILKSKLIYIILILAISIGVGYFYSFYYKVPLYQSSSTIVLAKLNDGTSSDAVTQNDLTLNQKLVSTYSQIIKSKNVLDQTINNLGIEMDSNTLSKQISVSSVSGTEIIKVSVTSANAEETANITNELVNVFSQEVKKIYNIDNINIIDRAKVETTPYNVNHAKDLILSIGAGLVLSCAFIFFLYLFDTSIKDEKDVEDYIKLSVLSKIPSYSKNDKQTEYDEIVTDNDRLSPISECFRNLKINLTFKKSENSIKDILVTSVSAGEGKSWISANLASIFAQANKNVLIIDSDMRKGRQHNLFNVSNNKGLSNCLVSVNSDDELTLNKIESYITETKIPGIHIITSGTLPPNPSELLSSSRMKTLLDEVNKIYDIVIIDGCPCKMVSDSIGLSNIVDTSIIVVECKKTKIDDVRNIKQQIENLGGNISGIVLNKISVSAKFYKNSYYYGHKSNKNLIAEKTEPTIAFKTVSELIQDYIEGNEESSEILPVSDFPANNSINNIDDFKDILIELNKQMSKITYNENIIQSKYSQALKPIKDSINNLDKSISKLQSNSNIDNKFNDLQDAIASLNTNLTESISKLQNNSNSDNKFDDLQDAITSLNTNLTENISKLQSNSNSNNRFDDLQDAIASLDSNITDGISKLQKSRDNEQFEQLKSSISNIKEAQKDEKTLVNLSLALKDLTNICNSQKQLIEQQVEEISSIKDQIAQMNSVIYNNRISNINTSPSADLENDENIIYFNNKNRYSSSNTNTSNYADIAHNNTESGMLSNLFNKKRRNEYSVYDSIPYEDLERNSKNTCQILNTANNMH